jgi:hypothetical protein
MKKIFASIVATFLSILVFAQEKGAEVDVDVTKTTTTTHWYSSPWIWVVGAAIFILLLVALTRGSGRRAD